MIYRERPYKWFYFSSPKPPDLPPVPPPAPTPQVQGGASDVASLTAQKRSGFAKTILGGDLQFKDPTRKRLLGGD